MIDLLIYVAAAFPILAILIALTFLTPTWHWPIGFLAALGALLIWIWLDHWHAVHMPHYKEGPGGGLELFVVTAWTIGYAIASASYLAGLIWWHKHISQH